MFVAVVRHNVVCCCRPYIINGLPQIFENWFGRGEHTSSAEPPGSSIRGPRDPNHQPPSSAVDDKQANVRRQEFLQHEYEEIQRESKEIDHMMKEQQNKAEEEQKWSEKLQPQNYLPTSGDWPNETSDNIEIGEHPPVEEK